jgi:REP element-mobilizing transposase RayT
MELLIPECSYHIYNHSNGNDLLFKDAKNYFFFLDKYQKFISPVADTFVYCLMPNHFHLLVQIKKETDIILELSSKNAKRKYDMLETTSEKEKFVSLYVSKQFSNLFSSYTQAFNKVYNRMGSLFIKNFKRKRINDNNYFLKLIVYIHLNPVTHKFVQKPDDWKYSSYNTILSSKPTFVKREEVIELYGDVENFKFCHTNEIDS